MDKPNTISYTCNVCGETYKAEALQKACEQIPVSKSSMPLGTVFRCEDGLLGILYDSAAIGKQDHTQLYEIVRTGLTIHGKEESYEDEPWHTVPKFFVGADYLNQAQPVTDEEFRKAKEALELRIKHSESSALKAKIEKLTLTTLK